jgi:hypothetical protein
MKWTIGKARERFQELLRKAATSPQEIHHNGRLVAAVIGPEALSRYSTSARRDDPSLEESCAKLRKILADEGFKVGPPKKEEDPGPGDGLLSSAP